ALTLASQYLQSDPISRRIAHPSARLVRIKTYSPRVFFMRTGSPGWSRAIGCASPVGVSRNSASFANTKPILDRVCTPTWAIIVSRKIIRHTAVIACEVAVRGRRKIPGSITAAIAIQKLSAATHVHQFIGNAEDTASYHVRSGVST